MISDRARELHKRAIIIDGHNDTLILRQSRGEHLDVTERDERYHLDVPRALEGGLTCSMFMVGDNDLDQTMELVDGTWRLAEEHPEMVIYAMCAADIERAKAEGKYAVFGQLEGCTCLHENLATLRNLYRLGVRTAHLTHGGGGPGTTQHEGSPFGFCELADRERARHEMAGLTDFGREVIGEMNRLGIIVDLAHANDATWWQAMELSETPPIFSHGAVFAQSPHWRGLTDDMLRALADRGGVMGMAFVPFFIDQHAASMERLVDSIEYVVDLVGPDCIGLGADYDGMSPDLTPVPAEVSQLPLVTDALVARGFDDETILKVLGGNFLRVIGEIVG